MSARPVSVCFERHEPDKTDKIPSRKKEEKKARHQLQQLQAVALGGEEGATGRGRRTIDQKRHGKER